MGMMSATSVLFGSLEINLASKAAFGQEVLRRQNRNRTASRHNNMALASGVLDNGTLLARWHVKRLDLDQGDSSLARSKMGASCHPGRKKKGREGFHSGL